MRVDTIALERGADPEPLSPEPSLAEAPKTSFEDVVAAAVKEASAAKKGAAMRADALAVGALDDLHGTMIAAKEAEISVHLIGTIRNKLLDAFHELWRIGV